jgi:hypothetical protein
MGTVKILRELWNVFTSVPRSVGSALPVMMSAGTWPKTPPRSSKAHSPTTGIPALAGISRYCWKRRAWPRAGSAANNTWIGRVAFVEPGRKNLRLSTQLEGGLL